MYLNCVNSSELKSDFNLGSKLYSYVAVYQDIDELSKDITSVVSAMVDDENIYAIYWKDDATIDNHEHNENEASEQLISYLLNGKNVCYVSDAGYPGISDPGSRLVKKALDNDINVSVINGSSAFLTALVASGLETDHFYFHGFLASKESQRENELKEMINRKETLIFYESPHRIMKTLVSMQKIFGNRKICLCRELTKKFEEYIRGTLDELVTLDENTLKGEMVVIVEGNKDEISSFVSDEDIMAYVNSLTEVGLSTKDAIKSASSTLKVNKNYIYKLFHTN